MSTADPPPRGHSSPRTAAAPVGGLVELAGDGAARGSVHGEELREPIAEALARWRHAIGESSGLDPAIHVRNFLGSTGFVGVIEELCPDLLAEVRAIAIASNQPVDDLLVYNFMDEEWVYTRSKNAGCSTIGISTGPDGTVVLGQNLDLPLYMGDAQAILRIAPVGDEPAQLVLTAAGMVGLLGVNSSGVACCVNTLYAMPAATTGLPVAFVIRQVLKHHDAAAAGRYLMALPHASGQHYGIGDRHGLRGFECSAKGCWAGPLDDKLLHTNHPLWWPDRDTEEGVHSGTTETRLRALEDGFDEVRRKGEFRTLLSSTADNLCVGPTPERRVATFWGAEFTLSTPPVVRVAPGRPDRTAWRRVEWAGDHAR